MEKGHRTAAIWCVALGAVGFAAELLRGDLQKHGAFEGNLTGGMDMNIRIERSQKHGMTEYARTAF